MTSLRTPLATSDAAAPSPAAASPSHGAAVPSRPRRRAGRPRWGSVAIWTVLGLLIVAPVVSFLLLATSPRLFQQGASYFTLRYIREALSGSTGRGIFDSLWVSTLVAVFSTALATLVAWLVQRTNVYGRRVWGFLMWLLLLVPTWMMTLGWGDLLQPYGAATIVGVNSHWLYGEFFGPLGIVAVLTTAALPFAYFIVSAAMHGLGSEFEDAARIHGAGRVRTMRTVLPIIAPALWSALAIGFAETMSDFGVAFTLGYHANFPMATYTLFAAISNFPANFSVAAVIALILIVSTIPPIALQARAARGRSYAVISGRTRTPRRREFGPVARLGVTAGLAALFVFALGAPIVGAVAGSFVRNLGIYTASGVHLTTAAYQAIVHPSITGKSIGAPLALSNQLGVVVATATGVLAYVLGRRLGAGHGGWGQRVTDVFLLGSVAIPGIVLGVGYIFFYNLSAISTHLVSLYQTLPLLMLALTANALPGQTRFLAGPLAQVQPSLAEAARVHGARRWRTWRVAQLPLVARILVWGWLLTFAKTISELAISQVLYPPSQQPVSVTIQAYLGNDQLGTGTAMTVLTLVEMLGVIGVVLGLFRLLTPRGWRRIGWSGVRS